MHAFGAARSAVELEARVHANRTKQRGLHQHQFVQTHALLTASSNHDPHETVLRSDSKTSQMSPETSSALQPTTSTSEALATPGQRAGGERVVLRCARACPTMCDQSHAEQEEREASP